VPAAVAVELAGVVPFELTLVLVVPVVVPAEPMFEPFVTAEFAAVPLAFGVPDGLLATGLVVLDVPVVDPDGLVVPVVPVADPAVVLGELAVVFVAPGLVPVVLVEPVVTG